LPTSWARWRMNTTLRWTFLTMSIKAKFWQVIPTRAAAPRASGLKDAARLVYTLVPMSEEEACKARCRLGLGRSGRISR